MVQKGTTGGKVVLMVGGAYVVLLGAAEAVIFYLFKPL